MRLLGITAAWYLGQTIGSSYSSLAEPKELQKLKDISWHTWTCMPTPWLSELVIIFITKSRLSIAHSVGGSKVWVISPLPEDTKLGPHSA